MRGGCRAVAGRPHRADVCAVVGCGRLVRDRVRVRVRVRLRVRVRDRVRVRVRVRVRAHLARLPARLDHGHALPLA